MMELQMEPTVEGLQASLNNANRAIQVLETQRNYFASVHVQAEIQRMMVVDQVAALQTQVKELEEELEKTKKAHLRLVENNESKA